MNESHVLNNLNHKNNQRKKDKKIFHVIENCNVLPQTTRNAYDSKLMKVLTIFTSAI